MVYGNLASYHIDEIVDLISHINPDLRFILIEWASEIQDEIDNFLPDNKWRRQSIIWREYMTVRILDAGNVSNGPCHQCGLP